MIPTSPFSLLLSPQPILCPNLTCGNRTGWQLLIEQSKFSDWQKVRIQENANEIPTGSMPRSLDVILRSEIVERAKAGDKCVFTGTFIVVPDVSQLGLPGVTAEMMRQNVGGRAGRDVGGVATQGVTGLKALGVRDLLYKTAFLGCMVTQADSRVSRRIPPRSRKAGKLIGIYVYDDRLYRASVEHEGTRRTEKKIKTLSSIPSRNRKSTNYGTW